MSNKNMNNLKTFKIGVLKFMKNIPVNQEKNKTKFYFCRGNRRSKRHSRI